MHMPHPELPPGLADAVRQAHHVVVFTGAGVSAESGIPTFRDALTGLWARFDPETLATPEAFLRDPAMVWGWYEWRRAEVLAAQPNPAHVAIAHLAQFVPQLTVITQNVDDLHERAGSSVVHHLHGRLHGPRCMRCARPYNMPAAAASPAAAGQSIDPPHCPACRGLVRPGVVWFGESLPEDVWTAAYYAAEHCDLLFSIGTSGLVSPAAELPAVAARAGARVVQVNPAPTPLDGIAAYNLQGPAAQWMPRVVTAVSPAA